MKRRPRHIREAFMARAHRTHSIAIASLVLAVSGITTSPCQASRVANPLFSYTHLLPSPFTLRSGQLVYGTEFALGITDFMQVGTNVFRDVFQFYNVNAKLSLFDWDSFASAFTFGMETYNYKNMDSSNPDLRVTTFMPGGILAFKVADSLAWFVGGNYNISKAKLITENLTTSGYIRGASGESDLTWAYNGGGGGDGDDAESEAPKKGRKGRAHRSSLGNAFSVGASYDFTYKMPGLGLSHHWPGFHLGFHYYPSATKYLIYPIIAGGGVIEF